MLENYLGAVFRLYCLCVLVKVSLSLFVCLKFYVSLVFVLSLICYGQDLCVHVCMSDVLTYPYLLYFLCVTVKVSLCVDL